MSMILKTSVPQLFMFPEHLKIPAKLPAEIGNKVYTAISPENRKYKYQPLEFFMLGNTMVWADLFESAPEKLKPMKVFWRDDLFELTLENLELMRKGQAPKDKKGRVIHLHHLTQTDGGPLCMISEKNHMEKYKRILHGIFPLSETRQTNRINQWLASLGERLKVRIAKPVDRKAFGENIRVPFWQFLYKEITGKPLDERLIPIGKPKLKPRLTTLA